MTHKFQLWRPITAFFFAGGSLDALINPFLLYQTSSGLEKEMYTDTASYAWMVCVLAVVIHVSSDNVSAYKEPGYSAAEVDTDTRRS